MTNEKHLWLAFRRDHHGNRVLLQTPEGAQAWELKESEVDAVIEKLRSQQTKQHGQEYIKKGYPVGSLKKVHEENYIAY